MAQTQEINIPVADPSDPYANPAAMPSSADRAPRSFDIEAFAKPDRKQEDWRYTPIERIEEFFDVFEPSNETQVTVSMIDGSPLAEGVTYAEARWGTPAQASSPSRTTVCPQSNGIPANALEY